MNPAIRDGDMPALAGLAQVTRAELARLPAEVRTRPGGLGPPQHLRLRARHRLLGAAVPQHRRPRRRAPDLDYPGQPSGRQPRRARRSHQRADHPLLRARALRRGDHPGVPHRLGRRPAGRRPAGPGPGMRPRRVGSPARSRLRDRNAAYRLFPAPPCTERLPAGKTRHPGESAGRPPGPSADTSIPVDTRRFGNGCNRCPEIEAISGQAGSDGCRARAGDGGGGPGMAARVAGAGDVAGLVPAGGGQPAVLGRLGERRCRRRGPVRGASPAAPGSWPGRAWAWRAGRVRRVQWSGRGGGAGRWWCSGRWCRIRGWSRCCRHCPCRRCRRCGIRRWPGRRAG